MEAYIQRNWRDLIKPRNLNLDRDSMTEQYGSFVAEPLERGFGITLGNSLRRVLLSALQGAAITSMKIEGALHEFTSIADVAEDVTEIMLNLKAVRLLVNTNETKTIRLDITGPKVVTAGDILLMIVSASWIPSNTLRRSLMGGDCRWK
jgi:DNA-directed RNA polymerase subunit alpha